MPDSKSVQNLKKEIEKLEEELSDVRSIALYLLPKKYRDLLYSFKNCTSNEELENWEHEIIDKIIEAHAQNRDFPTALHHKWTSCPLCDSSNLERGEFIHKFPMGLKRHLSWSRRSGRCMVMQVAIDLAREFGRNGFREKYFY